MNDQTQAFTARIRDAVAAREALRFVGGGSKDFYGQALVGTVLDSRGHSGILAYEPSELVLTARSGTSLAEVEAALAAKGQMLAFEPPYFSADGAAGATVGGVVAAGLSGPRRATAGAVRDFVLGTTIIDGRGEVQKFGGQVMKNVAGYDVSRLFAGSLGSLGFMLDVSLKVLPLPSAEASLILELDQAAALAAMNRWAGLPIPISATCWQAGRLTLRLSGARAAVASAQTDLGGARLDDAEAFWAGIRHQRAEFFQLAPGECLWRLSLPSVAPVLSLPGEQLIEWGGALRWLKSSAEPQTIRAAVDKVGGHASKFRSCSSDVCRQAAVFQLLTPAMHALQKRLKHSFDPLGIFNPGRLYADF